MIVYGSQLFLSRFIWVRRGTYGQKNILSKRLRLIETLLIFV